MTPALYDLEGKELRSVKHFPSQLGRCSDSLSSAKGNEVVSSQVVGKVFDELIFGCDVRRGLLDLCD